MRGLTLKPGIGVTADAYRGDLFRGRQVTFIAVSAAIAVTTLSLTPFLYMFVAFPFEAWTELDHHHFAHIGLLVAANLGCLLLAFRLRGSIRDNLGPMLMCVMLIHAVVVTVILGARLYYSRPIMLTAVPISITISTFALLVAAHFRPRRIGIVAIGLSDEIRQWVGADAVLLTSPDERIASYDVIVADFSKALQPEWAAVIFEAIRARRTVWHLSEYIEHERGRVPIEHFKLRDVETAWGSSVVKFYKRAFDVVLTLLVLPIVIVIVAAAALAILVTMGRPFLFTQPRVGSGGRIFTIYKLRTMTGRSDKSSATSKNDRRITPLGSFLRRTRIDELPQLMNVLKGDMSIVGPRPEQPQLMRRYLLALPDFRYRNVMPPGITGWAQIRAGYAADESETREKLMFDLYYVKNWSILLDMQIIAETVWTVTSGRGAR